jgi:hypothetical protein
VERSERNIHFSGISLDLRCGSRQTFGRVVLELCKEKEATIIAILSMHQLRIT